MDFIFGEYDTKVYLIVFLFCYLGQSLSNMPGEHNGRSTPLSGYIMSHLIIASLCVIGGVAAAGMVLLFDQSEQMMRLYFFGGMLMTFYASISKSYKIKRAKHPGSFWYSKGTDAMKYVVWFFLIMGMYVNFTQ